MNAHCALGGMFELMRALPGMQEEVVVVVGITALVVAHLKCRDLGTRECIPLSGSYRSSCKLHSGRLTPCYPLSAQEAAGRNGPQRSVLNLPIYWIRLRRTSPKPCPLSPKQVRAGFDTILSRRFFGLQFCLQPAAGIFWEQGAGIPELTIEDT